MDNIMSFDPNPSVTKGGEQKSNTTNATAEDLLSAILIELKKMNMHFEIINDEPITTEDIEEN